MHSVNRKEIKEQLKLLMAPLCPIQTKSIMSRGQEQDVRQGGGGKNFFPQEKKFFFWGGKMVWIF